MDRQKIRKAFEMYGVDKIYHGYDYMYSGILHDDITKLLEIGAYTGGSLAAWATLLPSAKIFGADIEKFNMMKGSENIPIVYGDSGSPGFADNFDKDFDIIIDDGNHSPDSQWATFLNFENSWIDYYVIEDIVAPEREAVLRRRFEARGYKSVQTFPSLRQNYTFDANNKDWTNVGRNGKKGEVIQINFCALLITR